MSRNYSKMLLVTANVGSIFEDPETMLQLWLQEFLATVKCLEPDFLAVHCQEVGGKNYEDSMQHVNKFIKALLASPEMQEFDRARLFLDEDFTAADKFTALGCLYFVHQSVRNVKIWDFQANHFVPFVGREVLSGNIESVSIKEKAKFPQEFFPDFKWSRKGFIRTRWSLCNTEFDLINIHLFHDASNIVAMETSPSQYSLNRKQALLHTLNRFDTDQYGRLPYFIFGDFNFRLDTQLITKDLTAKTTEHKTRGKKNEVSKVVYTEETDEENNAKVILTVGKKDFDHHRHNEMFFSPSKWLRAFDREPADFSQKIQEYEVSFPPSYPFSEDVKDGRSYMKTRVPSWCDRIMFTPSTRQLLHPSDSRPDYGMIGAHTCMGDHKPIYLNLKLRRETALPSRQSGGDLQSVASSCADDVTPSRQVRVTEIETTKYIHVRQNGAAVRVFRETSV